MMIVLTSTNELGFQLYENTPVSAPDRERFAFPLARLRDRRRRHSTRRH